MLCLKKKLNLISTKGNVGSLFILQFDNKRKDPSLFLGFFDVLCLQNKPIGNEDSTNVKEKLTSVESLLSE